MQIVVSAPDREATVEIPHSSKVVTGKRVPFWQRPDWMSWEGLLLVLSPVVVVGALVWEILYLRHGHLFDDDRIRITELGVPAGLIAIAIGVSNVYAKLIGDRDVAAPCPVCNHDQRWSPGDNASHCVDCDAYMRVDEDGTIRELGLDDRGRFTVYLEGADLRNGHPNVVMPPICAICGVEPTTVGKPKDDGSFVEKDEDSRAQEACEQIHRDLVALAVPLCAAHADQVALSVEAYSSSATLRFDIYRFYRAFLFVNERAKRHADAPAAAAPSAAATAAQSTANPPRPRTMPGQLEPLLCQHCGAPVPVSEGSETTCLACGNVAPLPEPYKLLRDSKRLSEEDARQLHALAAEVSKPAPAWQRTAMIVGYVVGGITLVVVALGGIIGAIGGVLIAGELKLGDAGSKFFAIVGAVAIGIVSVPFAGEWVAAVATLHDVSLATNIATGSAIATHYDLVAGGILYALGIIPIALAVHTQGKLDGIVALQSKLVAQPSTLPGGLCCRNCGAALDVASDALVSRCLYCGADNLLTVPKAKALATKDEATQIDASVQDAVAQRARERSEDRAVMWLLVLGGVLVIPYVCAAGYLLHRLVLG